MSAPPPAKQAGALDPTRTKLVREFKHTSPLVGCRIDPSGQFVFAGAQDNTINRWHLDSGKKTTLAGHKSWVRALAFSARERLLFSGDWAGKILVWPSDSEAPTPRLTIDAHQGWVRALAVSPDGNLLASCGNDLTLRLWSIPDCKPIRTFTGHTSHVYNVAFHPDGKRLVSGDLMGVIKEWQVAGGQSIRDLDASVLHKYDNTFGAHHGGMRGMAFSPDGSLLACCGISEVTNAFAGVGKPMVVLFDMQSGKVKQLLKPKTAFQGTAWGVVYHPAGFVLGVGGGSGGAFWAWKPTESLAFHTLTLPNNGRDLSLHPDGRRLAIPFFDGSVRLYDMAPA